MLFHEITFQKSMEEMKMKNRKVRVLLTTIGMAVVMSATACSDSRQTTEQLVTPKETQQESDAGQPEDRDKEPGSGQNSGAAFGNAADSGNDTGIADQVKAPERYEADFTSGAVNVHVDAEVIVPKAAGFKIYNVTGRPFEQADYDAVNQVLLKDASLWDRDYELLEKTNGFIKPEIEEKIALLEERAAEQGEDALVTAKEETYKEKIAEWKAMLEAAPEEAPIVEVEAVVPYVKSENGEYTSESNWLHGYSTVDGKEYWVSLENDWQEEWRWVQFEVRSKERSVGNSYIKLEEAEEPDGLSKDGIREAAMSLMQEMGFTDFAPAGEEYFQKIIADEYGNPDVEYGALGYGIRFTRVLDGIPTTYTHEYGTCIGENDEEPWPYEVITVVFDEQGITDFLWWNPYVIEKQSDEYVFLMPFSDIQDIFEEMILKKYEWITDIGDNITVYFDIDEIRLGYMRVIDEAGAEKGTMVPVWDFMGSQTLVYNDSGETSVNAGPYESWLTINAMDGTIIDRAVGY